VLPTGLLLVSLWSLSALPLATLTLCGTLAVSACSRDAGGDPPDWPALQRDIRQRFPRAPQLAASTLADWLASPERAPGGRRPVLLDARAPEEYAVSRLPGAYPTPDLASALEVLTGLQETSQTSHTPEGSEIVDTGLPPVVVYCSVGWRSSELVQELRDRGYDTVWNLEGSIFRWANEGRTVVRDGRPVRQVHPFDEEWGRYLDPGLRFEEPVSAEDLPPERLRP